jgi:acyl transferase domain-containing protein
LSEAADEAVAIVSIGAIIPGGRVTSDFHRLLDTLEDPRTDVPSERWNVSLFHAPGDFRPWRSPLAVGGFVKGFAYDWKRRKIPPKQVECADPLQFMILDAAEQALAALPRPLDEGQRARTGVVVGTIFGGDFGAILNMALRVPEFGRTISEVASKLGLPPGATAQITEQFSAGYLAQNRSLEDETGSYTSSTLASRVAKTLDLMGGACAIDAGGASGMSALGNAIDRLLSRQNDLIVCAAGNRSMDLSYYEALAAGGFLADAAANAAGEKAKGGLIPGEAAVAFVLKRASDALRDGDRVLGILRGYGAAADPVGHQRAVAAAMNQAWSRAGVKPAELKWVDAAAIGTPRIDEAEAAAITENAGEPVQSKPLRIASTAGQFGYCGGASGLVSLGKVLHAFERGAVPPNAVGRHAPAALAPGAWLDQALNLGRNVPGERCLAGVTAVALEPLACHVVVERPVDLRIRPVEIGHRIFRLGAGTPAELDERLSGSLAQADALFEQPSRAYRQEDRLRLAIVADSATTLAEKLKLAASQLGNKAAQAALAEQGISIGQITGEPLRIVCVFPGQGSQYPGMFRELASESTAAASAIDRLDALVEKIGAPRFAELAWGAAELGNDILKTQLAVLYGDWIAWEVLLDLGLRADVISSHSYGEYAALVAAGAWSLETAIRATLARCAAINACEGDRGRLLSTAAPLDVSEEICRETGDAYVANCNAPDQTVLGGGADAIAKARVRLEQAGFVTRDLDVPCAFHTPKLEAARAPYTRALADLPITPPQKLFLSSVTNRYTADPHEIRNNLPLQFVRPVQYIELVERLVADGVNVIVEAGPRQVLTRLERRILGEKPTLLVGVDNPKRPGAEALLRLRAALECAGYDFAGSTKPKGLNDAPSTVPVRGPAPGESV